MSFLFHNGQLADAENLLFSADNPTFKWGEGLFETIKVSDGNICLAPYHFERLVEGCQLLQIEFKSDFIDTLKDQVHILCCKNDCEKLGRVRISVYRKSNGLAGTVVQATPVENAYTIWNEKGWKTGLYLKAVKQVDSFSHLKTASYLPYRLAARYAQQQSWEECFLLNANGFVCDGSKSNIFLIKDRMIATPSIEEGCIGGVMRRYVIAHLATKGVKVLEKSISHEMMLAADEVFVSNAIIGIKWIENFDGKMYTSDETAALHRLLFA